MCTSSRTHDLAPATVRAGAPPRDAGDAPDRTSPRDGALRASDAEREAAAAELRAHAAAGRLEVEELEARVEAVLRARTQSEVGALLSDLPAAADAGRRELSAGRRGEADLRAFAMVMIVLLTIWLVTGAGHFWPLYPALGWGLPLLLGRARAPRPRAPA